MPDTNHYPALTQLEVEFDEHMREFRTGIETSEEFVYWLQRTAVLTLGTVADEKLTGLFTDPFAPTAIVLGQAAGPTRRDPSEEELEKETDQDFRALVESQTFTPAFRRAYSNLKTNANEYIEDSSGAGDDSPPALRPAIEELSARQREVLDDLFVEGGFPNETALGEWARDVVAATRGSIPDKHLRMMTVHGRDPALRAVLLGKGGHAPSTRQRFLETFAAKALLPSFNKAVRDLARTAGEQADDGAASSQDTVGV